MLVAIEGCIGSGKTSTATLVAEQLGWGVVLEHTSRHPFLADFYANIDRYKLETELEFVLLHYHQLHMLGEEGNVVADFSQGKDLIFARMNLEGEDLELFELLYDRLSARLEPPTLTIVLDLPTAALMERVQKRGRSYELNLSVAYMERLREFYNAQQQVLGLNVRLVPVARTDTLEEVAGKAVSLIREDLQI